MRPKPMMATSQVRMKISFPERTSTFSKKIGFDGFSRMVRVDLPYEHQDSIVRVRFGLCANP
jgi:hypothetical protein